VGKSNSKLGEAMDTNKSDETPTDIITSGTRNNKKLYLVVAGILVILAAVAGYFLLAKKSPLTNIGIGKPAIMLGSQRYVDACQLLPPAKTAEAFGELPAGSTVDQEFFEKSLEKLDDDKTSKCSYYYKGDKPTIIVEATTYPDEKEAQEDWYYPLKVSSGEFRKEAFAKPDIPVDPNDPLSGQLDSSGFDAIIEEGVKRAEAEDGGNRIKELGDEDILFVPYRQTYHKRFGNTLVSLNYVLGGFTKDPSGLPAEQVKKAFEVISANAANKNLAQEPLAATPFGMKDPAGKTKVFAPCAVLTAAAFKEATGQESSPEVQQTTVESGSSSADNYYVKNECTREAGDASKDGRYTANVELFYTKNEEISKKMYDSTTTAVKARGYASRDLKTNATAAVVLDQGGTESFRTVYGYARVGNYNIKVQLDKRLKADETPLSDDAHTKLINAVASYINQHK